jgi:hypothetical protein
MLAKAASSGEANGVEERIAEIPKPLLGEFKAVSVYRAFQKETDRQEKNKLLGHLDLLAELAEDVLEVGEHYHNAPPETFETSDEMQQME